MRIGEISVDIGDEIEGSPVLRLGCVGAVSGGVKCFTAVDLRYEQAWNYEALHTGSLSTSIALAPTESLTLTIRNTQRKQFDQETLDEVEKSTQTESTTSDKDTMNVTRAAARTNSWTVSGNASVSYGGLGAGMSGSLSESVSESSNSSAARSREATLKAASNLKAMHKVQVRETTELFSETSTTRKITNPYRDRSIRLDVYELAKTYCVEFSLTGLEPVLLVDVSCLDFDRHFVLSQAAFLGQELIDAALAADLDEALRVVTSLDSENLQAKVEDTALTALFYLFQAPNIFSFGTYPIDATGNSRRPTGWNENDPANSFRNPLSSWSGLQDSTNNRLGVVFTTLAVFHRLYLDKVVPTSNGELALEIALSIDQGLGPMWIGVQETQEMADVLDEEHATEVLRRLGGFLTMVEGMIRPKLSPAAEELTARRNADRAEFVIARILEHVQCHCRYYTEQFLAYVGRTTRLRDIHTFIEELLANRLGITSALAAKFDASAAFIDGTTIVVPLRNPIRSDRMVEVLNRTRNDSAEIALGLLQHYSVVVPTDGYHIEAQAGSCVLGNLEPVPSVPLRISVESSP